MATSLTDCKRSRVCRKPKALLEAGVGYKDIESKMSPRVVEAISKALDTLVGVTCVLDTKQRRCRLEGLCKGTVPVTYGKHETRAPLVFNNGLEMEESWLFGRAACVPDLTNTRLCRDHGACSINDCARNCAESDANPGTDNDCRQSKMCRIKGECTLSGGPDDFSDGRPMCPGANCDFAAPRCVPGSPQDCKRSTGCRKHRRCRMKGKRWHARCVR